MLRKTAQIVLGVTFGKRKGDREICKAEMLRKTAETVLGVTFGKRKGDR